MWKENFKNKLKESAKNLKEAVKIAVSGIKEDSKKQELKDLLRDKPTMSYDEMEAEVNKILDEKKSLKETINEKSKKIYNTKVSLSDIVSGIKEFGKSILKK